MQVTPRVLRFFLGANTPQGFVSRFDQLGNPADDWRLYVVKGGPGSGKSTMMKRAAEALGPGCDTIELIHCSSDVDSLDGVILPCRKISIADGTPPHPIEPRYPGAYETLVPVCSCWDAGRLFARRREIMETATAVSGCHEYCVRFLTAAGSLLADTYRMALEVTDTAKIARYAASFAAREFGRPKVYRPKESVRFLSAVTNKGPTLFADTAAALAGRIFFIDDEYGAASRLLLNALRSHALEAGFEIISCYCPLAPYDKLEHLFLPELGLGLMTSNRFHTIPLTPRRTIHARRFCDIDSLKLRKKRVSFNARGAAQMLEQAAALLAEAKEKHDRLEQFYIEAADFDKVNAMTAGLIDAIRRNITEDSLHAAQ